MYWEIKSAGRRENKSWDFPRTEKERSSVCTLSSGDAERVSANCDTVPKSHATGEMSKTILKGERIWKSGYSLSQACCPSAFLHPSVVRHLLLCFCFTGRLAHLFTSPCHLQRLLFPQGISPLVPVMLSESQCLWVTKAVVTGSICTQVTPRKLILNCLAVPDTSTAAKKAVKRLSHCTSFKQKPYKFSLTGHPNEVTKALQDWTCWGFFRNRFSTTAKKRCLLSCCTCNGKNSSSVSIWT